MQYYNILSYIYLLQKTSRDILHNSFYQTLLLVHLHCCVVQD